MQEQWNKDGKWVIGDLSKWSGIRNSDQQLCSEKYIHAAYYFQVLPQAYISTSIWKVILIL